MFKTFTIAAFLLASANPSLAASDQPAAEADDQKVICKSKPRPNSRFGKRTCRTRAEWQKQTDQHRRDAADIIERPIICTGKEGC